MGTIALDAAASRQLMAIPLAAAVSGRDEEESSDGHEHDVVMPGFRFHPTEEELIEFYLRRKVEGKPFNVELITFLDLYRYDPWELPALAAIGEKEWFFYVPRDRKYRNGDRPNRVTASGYWKATGADRMIRGETARPIGLKKTLVFYSGKAPKGVRTSWIMNEYRLPQNETIRSQKAEISLCRVYKRPGVPDDNYLLPGCITSRPSSSRPGAAGSDKKQNFSHRPAPAPPSIRCLIGSGSSSYDADSKKDIVMVSSMANDIILHNPPHPVYVTAAEETGCMPGYIIPCPLLSSISTSMPAATIDELNRLAGMNAHGGFVHHASPQIPRLPSPTEPPQQLAPLPGSLPPSNFSADKFWEWGQLPECGKVDYDGDFK